jgi:hypothetical protein
MIGAAIMMGMTMVMFFPVMSSAESSSAPNPPLLDEVLNNLDNIPSAWSQKLPAAKRFMLVLDGEAVLDKETGLVWERSVSALSSNWYNAVLTCLNLEVGGRKGWHLPTIEQLASLVDTSAAESPKLMAGHPFEGVQPLGYWSATTDAIDTTFARSVGFSTGRVLRRYKTGDDLIWCVRGGQSHDGQ